MRKASLANSFTKGVVQELDERIDLAHYYNSLADGVNCDIKIQGGLKRRGGLSLLSDYDIAFGGYQRRLRRRLEPVHLTAGMLTPHNGGTAGNLIDQDSGTGFTTSPVAGSQFVLIEVDLGSAQPIVFFDVLEIACGSGRWDDVLAVEYWTGSAWVQVAGHADPALSPRRNLRTTARTRRFGEWPGGPNGVPVSARNWRVTLFNAAGAGAVSLAGIRLWKEKRDLSPVREIAFAKSKDVRFLLVLTDRNIDVFRNGRYMASIPAPFDGRQIEEVTFYQSLDTLLLYHEDVQTQVVTRQGASDEWNIAGATFTTVPNLSSGTAFSGDEDELQSVSLEGLQPGQSFVLWFGDMVTAPIAYTSLAALPASVAAALDALPGVAAPVVTAGSGPFPKLTVNFTGANGARRWPVLAAVALGAEGVVQQTEVVQRGLLSSGPLMGATTGWPRCGFITQGRHLVAGFRASQSSWHFSRVGQLFDLTSTGSPLTADLGFGGTLDSDTVETIQQVYVGRHIQFFTDASAWYVEARTLDATQPINIIRAASQGIKSSAPVVFADGASVFVQAGGRVLRDFIYADVEASYKAEPLSLLAPQLLTDVVDVGFRQALTTDEGNRVFMVNRAGDVAMLAFVRSQEVIASVPWATDGAVRAVSGDVAGDVWFAVERSTLTGGADLYLEKLDPETTLDCATCYWRDGAAIRIITGAGHLEGKDVWAWADRELLGPFTVSSGQFDLGRYASRVVYGLFPELRGRLPRIREKLQNGQPFRAPGRIYEMEVSVKRSGALEVAANEGPWRDVPMTFLDDTGLDIATAPARDWTNPVNRQPDRTLERTLRSLMLAGHGEFALNTGRVDRIVSGTPSQINANSENGAPDFLAALGLARLAVPGLTRMTLPYVWFGDDLRCGSCTVRPKVETGVAGGVTYAPSDWAVTGLTRATAQVVTTSGGKPAYGGTPSDLGVTQAIAAMRDLGIATTLAPVVLMDIASGNALPNPAGGTGQGAYPWRGSITCTPAPGQPGSPDQSPAAAAQVQAFVGTAAVSDFSIVGGAVVYAGPAEWGYRRFVLHAAFLAKAAGGVDTFVLGSQLCGLGQVRSASNTFPFVSALMTLAADVKAVLGTETLVTYAADWSEYFGYRTAVAGEIYYHLDPLWASPHVDAVGIDWQAPLADWRDGTLHLDYLAGTRAIYDTAYLRANIFGGEGYDWIYASPGDRGAQVRTPITDAGGKPWIWRVKDFRSWWQNAHYNRPGGVALPTPTAWVPQSKPVWLMRAGCAAIDKGANAPHAVYDPKSSTSALPPYSSGVRDDLMQRRCLEAVLSFFDPADAAFDDINNPVSTVTGTRMVDVGRIAALAWDVRPYPAFPNRDFWPDGPLWSRGPWLSGRLSAPSFKLSEAVAAGSGIDLPMMDRLISATLRIENLRGWSRHPTIEFRQTVPAPLEINAIRYEVSHHG